MTGIQLVAKERKKQLKKYSIESDKQTNKGMQLLAAAIVLTHQRMTPEYASGLTPTGWDKEGWKKMCHKPHKEKLIIAAAFIAAELDRIAEK